MPWPSGELGERTFAKLVGHVARTGPTGLLELVDSAGTSRAFFVNGVPQGGRPARLKNPIGQILLADGAVTEAVLKEALVKHHETEKLLGQVLLEMGAVDEAALQRSVEKQSRLHFLSLFATVEGRYEWKEGLVHLQNFVAAPIAPVVALYQGLRDFAPEESVAPFLAKLPFASVKLVDPTSSAEALGPAEHMALKLLSEPRLPGDLARRVPLPAKALGALLAALDELKLLDIGPALRAR